jgi:PKD repeat protein
VKKNFVRSIKVLTAVLLFFMLFAGQHALAVQVTVGNGTGAAGSTGNQVTISADSVPANVGALGIKIQYPKASLTATSTPVVTANAAFTALAASGANWTVDASITNPNATDELLTILFMDQNLKGLTAASGAITLLTINFNVPAGATSGTSVTMTASGDGLADTGGNPIATTFANGTFCVGSCVSTDPTITNIAPNSGPIAGGTPIVITGTNFAAGATVTIGGAAATGITVTGTTQINCTTPAGTAGAQNVVVTVGTKTATSTFTYTSTDPTVTGIAPATGSAAGGTDVTITGTNFASGATVTIGGASATSVVVVNATTITCKTPTGTAGTTVAVAVTVSGKTGTLPASFTYTTPPPTASNTVLVTTAGVAKSSTLSATGGTAPYTFSKVADSANGLSTVNAGGSYGYSPNANFSGTDSFTFIATDSATPPVDSNVATVTITVLPVANAAAFGTTKGTSVTGTLTALGKGPFTYTVTQPANGTVTPNSAYPNFKYAPNADYVSAGTPPVPDTFTFTVKDANGLSSASATVSVTVYASNTAPVANNLTLTTRPDQAVNGVLSATDAEGNPLTYTIVTPPANGTLVPNTAYPNFTYTPNTGFGAAALATDTFTFKVNDGTADSAANGTVTINVTPFTATNNLPVANSGAYTGTVGQTISGKLNGTDADGDLLSYIIVTEPACGDIQLSDGNSPDAGVPASFTYLPRLDKAGCTLTGTGGTDSFTYKVKERANTPTFPESAANGTITLTINAVCTPTITTATLTSNPAATGGTITVAAPPQSVTFTDTTAGASRVWTIVDTASGSTVATSTVTPFTYSFTTAGTYTVNLIAADASGCATPQAATVTVVVGSGECSSPATILTSPAATSGVVTIASTALPQTVNFQNTTGTSSQTWTMMNTTTGQAVTLTNPTNQTASYTFAVGSEGTYTVTLSTTRTGCTTPSTATVTVNVGTVTPTTKITGIMLNPSNSNQLLISGTGFSAACSEVWYNTTPSTTGAIRLSPITVNTAGTQITAPRLAGGTYYFFVKNVCVTPNTWSAAFVYTVPQQGGGGGYVPPVSSLTADFNVNGSTDQVTGCAPLDVTFKNTSTGSILTYVWDCGNGTASYDKDGTCKYPTPGTYSVTLTVSGLDYPSTKTLTNFVKVTESCCTTTASFTANPTTGTAPLAVSFDASASVGANFSWDFGDTQTGTGKTATHTYAAAGTYTVKLSVTDDKGNCPQTLTSTVSVAAPVNCDVVAASFSANPTSGNKPLAVHFDASASKSAASYAWDYGDALTGSGVTSDHTYTTAKDYTVTLTVKDATGKCTKTATQIIKVASGPCTTAASFTADPMTGEVPLNVLFNAAGSSADVKSYSWDYGDGQTDTGVAPTKHSFTKAGSYTVTLTVTGDCTASAKKTIEVKATDRPNKPVLLTPANGTTRVPLTPTLTVQSNYSSPVNAPQAKTRWQIALDKDFNNLVYDVTNGQNLTSIWVPDFILKPNTVYYWRVQFIDNRGVASDWSDSFSFTTVETNAEDTNNSGVPDTQEAASTDASSVCAKSPKSGVVVCVKSSNGVKTAGLKWISASTLAAGPSGISFPSDLFTFRQATTKAGDKVTMTYTFSEALPAEAVWYKYNQIDGWKEYALNISADRKTVTQVLTEGVSGDSDGTANAVIVDPVGFGVGAAAAACLDCGDDGGGGCFISAVSGGTASSAGMAILTLFSIAGIYLSRRSK